MSLILSVQSHVSYGYVGNRAAQIPINALGHEIVMVNTVQFSNHTGYGAWQGDVFSVDHVSRVLEGIKERGIFPKIDAVLSGYIGDPDIGDLLLNTLKDLRKENPNCFYCCDPVMGDIGRGFFVNESIPKFFKKSAIQQADLIVPNQFEASFLSGVEIKCRNSAKQALDNLHAQGIKRIVITSFTGAFDNAKDNEQHISMIMSEHGREALVISTPCLTIEPLPNGAGDVTASLLLSHILRGKSLNDALEHAASALYHLFDETKKAERRELALIESQPYFNKKELHFKTEPL